MTDKTTDLAPLPTSMTAMITADRPTGADEGRLGTEHIGQDDILIPRIGIAQKTSPEIDPTSPRHIGGLQFTDLYGSVSRQNLGKGPLLFTVIRADKPRWVEFNPLDQGGGVRDPNVKADDPRTQFGPIDPTTGKAEKPKATKFYDFLVLLLNDLDFADPVKNVMSLSLKSTGIKVAKQLNMLITQRGPKALYKGVYELRTGSDSNPNGVFAIYKVQNAGWLASGSQLEVLAAEMFENWKDRRVKVDLDHPDADSFDPVEIEKGTTAEM